MKMIRLLFSFMLGLTAVLPVVVQAQAPPGNNIADQKQVAPPSATKPEPISETTASNTEAPHEGSLADPEPNTPPLEADGLIARALDGFGHWLASLSGQLLALKHSAAELGRWLKGSFSDDAWRQLLFESVCGLLAVFIPGVFAQALVGRSLRYPRRKLAERAADVVAHMYGAAKSAHANAAGQLAAAARQAADDQALAGLTPEQDNIVLVQTVRDGVEHVESMTVQGAEDAESAPMPAYPAGADKAPMHDEPPPHKAPERAVALSHGEIAHRTLCLFPFAFGTLLLDLLGLVAFFCAAALAVRVLPTLDPHAVSVTRGFVNAYVTTCISTAVLRVLIAPYGRGVRLLRVTPTSAHAIYTWLRRFIVFTTFGIALASSAGQLGAGEAGSQAMVKLVSLCIHLAAVMVIFRFRKPIGDGIAAAPDAAGLLASFRNWVAKVWVIPAGLLVMGLWFIWALGVENGFPRLMTFIAVTAAILVAGRLVDFIAQGLVAKALHIDNASGADTSIKGGFVDLRSSMGQRYYPMIRRLISFVVMILTAVALLQSQGINAIAWFAPGTIGGGMTSAALTIVTAVAIAVIVWYLVDTTVQRRVKLWTSNGDLTRAARLKTLLPMMRTILLIVLTLVVGLTALNEIGINTAPLLAGASIVGVALGFGSQKLVQDFITGIFLLVENAMQVGDGVTIAGVSGTVEYLSIRTVRLRAGDGSLHIIPFSSVSTVNNTNRGIGNATVRVNIGYEVDVNVAISELAKIGAELRADPTFEPLILADMEIWGVDAIDGSMFTLAGQIRCLSNGRWGVQRETNRRILERFRKLKIRIADPRERLLMPDAEQVATRATVTTPEKHGN